MLLQGPRGKATGMRLPALFAFVLLIALAPNPALAARVDAKERAAKKACLTGDATKGVALLADLFIDTEDPTYLYNQGRCLEQNNRYEEAINKFREYLRKATKASAADKADAEKHIVECQSLSGKKEPETAPPSKPAPEAPKPEPPAAEAAKVELPPPTPVEPPKQQNAEAALVVAPPATLSETPKPSESTAGGSGLRTVGIVAVATGAAALAAGLALNLKHNSMVSDLQKSYDPDPDSEAKTYRTLSLVGYGVGAACVVGGAVLYYLGWQAGRVTVAPAPVSGLGGALVVGGSL
jgi:tetratricopeptide (TPR) repeat protein